MARIPNILATKCAKKEVGSVPTVTLPNSKPSVISFTERICALTLEISDISLVIFVVAPFITAYWRGTWHLIDIFVLPKYPIISGLVTYLCGGLIQLVLLLIEKCLRKIKPFSKKRLICTLMCYLRTEILGTAIVGLWRGIWNICDLLPYSSTLESTSALCIITLAIVMLMRQLRDLTGSPYSTPMYQPNIYFVEETMVKTPCSRNSKKTFFLDSLYTIFILELISIVSWRNLWELLDLTLFPEDEVKSRWVSYIMGSTLIIFSLLINPLIRFLCRKYNGIRKWLICDIYLLILYFGSINAWRGVWDLLDLYFLPDDKLLSSALCHAASFLFLIAMNYSHALLPRTPIQIDDSQDACVKIPLLSAFYTNNIIL